MELTIQWCIRNIITIIIIKDIVSAKGVPELNVGDSIRIVYNGLKRTQPEEMKIVYAIYHLDANGEIVSE